MKILKYIKKQLRIIFKCNFLKLHNWTSRASEGIISTPEEIKALGMEYCFRRDAKLYCKDCGDKSNLHSFEK